MWRIEIDRQPESDRLFEDRYEAFHRAVTLRIQFAALKRVGMGNSPKVKVTEVAGENKND